ncbi:hypothetical protein E2C01_041926 [Portunus trituberculatus]|uniref:Uncharacterized protein n=1 Tax=Portunus trituberculatus TaxID=210409 RepID=A0A5B7FT66_PORTR|nr:hypothetical protein [Portunus trituberculatus]
MDGLRARVKGDGQVARGMTGIGRHSVILSLIFYPLCLSPSLLTSFLIHSVLSLTSARPATTSRDARTFHSSPDGGKHIQKRPASSFTVPLSHADKNLAEGTPSVLRHYTLLLWNVRRGAGDWREERWVGNVKNEGKAENEAGNEARWVDGEVDDGCGKGDKEGRKVRVLE